MSSTRKIWYRLLLARKGKSVIFKRFYQNTAQNLVGLNNLIRHSNLLVLKNQCTNGLRNLTNLESDDLLEVGESLNF